MTIRGPLARPYGARSSSRCPPSSLIVDPAVGIVLGPQYISASNGGSPAVALSNVSLHVTRSTLTSTSTSVSAAASVSRNHAGPSASWRCLTLYSLKLIAVATGCPPSHLSRRWKRGCVCGFRPHIFSPIFSLPFAICTPIFQAPPLVLALAAPPATEWTSDTFTKPCRIDQYLVLRSFNEIFLKSLTISTGAPNRFLFCSKAPKYCPCPDRKTPSRRNGCSLPIPFVNAIYCVRTLRKISRNSRVEQDCECDG